MIAASNQITSPWKVHKLASLDTLLIEFQDLFAEPKDFPPKRPFDHSIPLQPNTEPVNIRSYRYPHKLKTKIEKLVKESWTTLSFVPAEAPLPHLSF